MVFRKNLYKWHRRLSLVIALPLVLSAGSGILHPIMTNIRPAVATQGLNPVGVDSSQLLLPLETALRINHIDTISRFRLVHIDTNWFYQVQTGETDTPRYLSTRTGKLLPKGDWLYAIWLARQFLEGPTAPETRAGRTKPPAMAAAAHPAVPALTMAMTIGIPDCCTSATAAILRAKGSKVLDEARLTAFDEEYNSINRLLPVYKVAFDRPDGIRIYVETAQDRFAYAVDRRRATFNRVFNYIHTYQWLDFLGRGRLVVESGLIGLAFVTTLLGISIFFSTRSKRAPGNGYTRARRNHRYTAITVSLFTLMFTFSGAYHALYKLKTDTRDRYFAQNRFAADSIRFDYATLASAVRQPISGIGLVAMGPRRYWQVTVLSGKDRKEGIHKDLMKEMQASGPKMYYVDAADASVLPDGDARYADFLATQFSGHAPGAIRATSCITRFDDEYNFTDKRLPVWKVSYASGGHERYFVETSSGRLSARVDDWDLLEGYSFALLHKHEFLGWAGKGVKDASTIFWAAAQLVMVGVALALYFAWRRRQKKSTAAGKERQRPGY